MSFELDENTGTIFKNKYKKDEKHPDYKGMIKLDGEDKGIALWLRQSKNGTNYMFAKVSELQKKAPEQEKIEDFDDKDIPF